MLTLCLEHFNELCLSALTEQDVRFHEAVCEVCGERKPCVLAYNADALSCVTQEKPEASHK